MTVHNTAFQGQFGAQIFGALDLPPRAFAVDGVEYYGGVGFLKAGLRHADAITTVSPTYAAEIRTPACGMGLEGLLDTRAGALHGIVNGIDTEVWDPATDPHLEAGFTPRRLKGRGVNRQALETRFGLAPGEGPIFCVISRLTWQKGMDLLAAAADGIVAGGGRLAVLGTGEAWIEDAFRAVAARHPGRVGVVIGYDEALAHLMQGGADAIVIPSRFEPCGLTQLCGLRYGCVPVVARTGGLADTVIDANVAALQAGVATGLQFAPGTPQALERALERAAALFAERETWTAMQRQGMKADVSWDRSAKAYADLYASLAQGPRA
jgi:starch synthase